MTQNNTILPGQYHTKSNLMGGVSNQKIYTQKLNNIDFQIF